MAVGRFAISVVTEASQDERKMAGEPPSSTAPKSARVTTSVPVDVTVPKEASCDVLRVEIVARIERIDVVYAKLGDMSVGDKAAMAAPESTIVTTSAGSNGPWAARYSATVRFTTAIMRLTDQQDLLHPRKTRTLEVSAPSMTRGVRELR